MAIFLVGLERGSEALQFVEAPQWHPGASGNSVKMARLDSQSPKAIQHQCPGVVRERHKFWYKGLTEICWPLRQANDVSTSSI